VPAAFEEQHPLDLEALRSEDANNSISGVPPSVTIGPAGGSDGTLKGYQPGYKPVTGTASSSQKCIPFLAVTMISRVNLASIFGWRPATRGSRNCLRWAFSSLWTRMIFLPATRVSTAACLTQSKRMATGISRARERQQETESYGDTFALTWKFSCIRSICAIAAQKELILYQFDVKGAFLLAKVQGKSLY